MPDRIRRGESSGKRTTAPSDEQTQDAAEAGLSGLRVGRSGKDRVDHQGGGIVANVIQLVDGSIHTLFHEWDILDLVDEQMGYEAREAIKDLLLEKDYDDLK